MADHTIKAINTISLLCTCGTIIVVSDGKFPETNEPYDVETADVPTPPNGEQYDALVASWRLHAATAS